MPIYEFKCRACGHQFEELVSVGQSADCPSCKGSDVERLLSLPAISTASTRERSLSAARRTASSVKRDQDHAKAEYERNYFREHSDSD